MTLRKLLFGLILAMSCLQPAQATEPYTVDVWARVLFDELGAAQQVDVLEAQQHPAAFVAAVRTRLERARIEPRTLAGSPATFRTGVKMSFEVRPAGPGAGGTVRVLGLHMLPLPLVQRYADFPKDIAAADGWSGSLAATCTVSTAGTCRQVAVKADAALPESARRFARASLELWTFEPQRVGDQPIEGEYTEEFKLSSSASAPEDFRQDKFLRAISGR